MNKASFFQRAAAWLIDQFILWIINLLAVSAFGLASGLYSRFFYPDGRTPAPNLLLSLGLSVFMLALAFEQFLYFGYFWSRRERSIGMGVMNIRVVTTEQRPLSFVMAGLRGSLGYYLSGLVFGLGYFWVFVDRQHETWHDKVFNTVVLKG